MDPRLQTYLGPERRLWEDEQATNNIPWHIFNLEQSRLQTEVKNAEGYTAKRAARTASTDAVDMPTSLAPRGHPSRKPTRAPPSPFLVG